MVKLSEAIDIAEQVEGQAAAEHKYLQEVRDFLIQAQDELKKGKMKKARAHMHSAIRELGTYAARTERLLERAVEKEFEQMKDLHKHLPENLVAQVEKLDKELHVFLGDALKNLSRFEGDLRPKLQALERNFEDDNLSPEQRLTLVGQVGQLRQLIENLQKELAGAITDEKTYKNLLTYLDELAS